MWSVTMAGWRPAHRSNLGTSANPSEIRPLSVCAINLPINTSMLRIWTEWLNDSLVALVVALVRLRAMSTILFFARAIMRFATCWHEPRRAASCLLRSPRLERTYVMAVNGNGRGHLTQAKSAKETLEACGVACAAILGPSNAAVKQFAESLNVPLLAIEEQQAIEEEPTATRVRKAMTFVGKAAVRQSLTAAECVASSGAFVLDFFSVPASTTVRPWCPRETRWLTICSSARHDFQRLPGDFNFLCALIHRLGFFSTSPHRVTLSMLPAAGALPPLVAIPERSCGDLLVGYFNTTTAGQAAFEVLVASGRSARIFAPGPSRTGGDDDCVVLRPPNDTEYAAARRQSRGFFGSAGFESVAENLLCGLPMVLSPANVEQQLNALEYAASFSGVRATSCLDVRDLDWLDDFGQDKERLVLFEAECSAVRAWHAQGPALLLEAVERAGGLV